MATERTTFAPTGYIFEQFRMARGCLGYVVADPET